jgi:hypothetical protein
VLSHKQRAVLWRKDSRFPRWACIWRPLWPDQETLLSELVSIAREDGIEIKFVQLVGRDTWNVNHPRRHYEDKYDECLISDIARQPSWVGYDGTPQPVKGYTAWEMVSPVAEPVVWKDRGKVRLDGTSVFDHRPTTYSPTTSRPAVLDFGHLKATSPTTAGDGIVVLSSRGTLFRNPSSSDSNGVRRTRMVFVRLEWCSSDSNGVRRTRMVFVGLEWCSAHRHRIKSCTLL